MGSVLPVLVNLLFQLALCLIFEVCPPPPPTGGGVPTTPSGPTGPSGPSTPSNPSPLPGPAPPTPPSGGPVNTGQFAIRLVNMGTATDFDDVFDAAKARWERVVVNDLPDIGIESFPEGDMFNGFFSRPLLEPVDDVTIGYELIPMEAGRLGRAGPRFVRGNSGTTGVGVMQFNLNFFRSGSFADNLVIVIHEMGHVLGLGLRWDNAQCDSGCRINEGSFQYTCRGAVSAYQTLLGNGRPLRIANEGGAGSSCVHWDDSSFQGDTWSEIMTPFFNPNKAQLLTTVSVASLADIGDYQVNLDAADTLASASFPNRLLTSRVIDLTTTIVDELEPDVLPGL